MALTDEGGNMVMPVSPMYGGGGYGNSGFGFGGDATWLIILFLFAFMGNGWGGGFGGGNGGGNGNALYPWMNQSNQINDGFRDQMINSNINNIQSGINDISTQLCNGFAGVEAGANARQIADMQQNFAMQTAMNTGFNGVQSQLAQTCCDNRSAIQDVKYTIANESSATRAANAANTQSVLDKLCQLELDGVKAQLEAKNDRISELQTQLNMATLAASQTRQTADIRNDIIGELRSCPIPAQPVYGSQPIFQCNGNNGCGCGQNFYN